MAFRLARVPLVEFEHTLTVGGEDVILRAYQPVVWVRLVPWGAAAAGAVAFPAVVDTGNNHSFLIPARLFRAWTGADPDLAAARRLIANGHPVACLGYNLDLMRLRDGDLSVPERVAARLQTGQGVAVVPDALASRFPRLAVLGVRCLTANRVRFALDGGAQTFSLSQGSFRPPTA